MNAAVPVSQPAPTAATGPDDAPRRWETTLAWVLRALVVGTAVVHGLQGKYLYALLCLGVIGLLVAPPLLARSSRANVPIELELAALWGAVSDMTLGRLGGLYGETIWFDKLLHFGNSTLIGLLAFLVVYALRFLGQLRASSAANGVLIVLIALGVGATWEIAEYLTDLVFHQGAQGSPSMTPLDDTMWDLMLDGVGGALGGLIGSAYMRWSKRSARRMEAFARLVNREGG